jgi:anti-anti-sigma factor
MLRINVKQLGTVAFLHLQGQIVNGETELLRNAVHSLSEVSAVKLDLGRVTTLDAGGLGAMLELRERAEARGIRFELMNITRQIRKVLEITRLDSVFLITPGVESFPAVSRRQASAAPLASCA